MNSILNKFSSCCSFLYHKATDTLSYKPIVRNLACVSLVGLALYNYTQTIQMSSKTHVVQWAPIATKAVVCLGGMILIPFEYYSRQKLEERKSLAELIPNLNKNSETDEWILIASPHSDHNGAFVPDEIFLKDIKRLNQKYKILQITWKTPRDIQRACRTMQARGERLSHVIHSGHGCFEGITGSDDHLGGAMGKKHLQRELYPGLDPKGHIILDACSGGIENGIAKHLSKVYPRATVYGGNSITYRTLSHLYLDSEGNPAILQFDLKDQLTTRVYKNGVPSLPPLARDFTSIEDGFAAKKLSKWAIQKGTHGFDRDRNTLLRLRKIQERMARLS